MNEKRFSPSDFMRERRPGNYSDSPEQEVDSPSKSLLEYHLETLTSRNQHEEFELLARRVSERAVCPNLIPQTGPVGGGDSKVDSETFPVSEDISNTWLQGDDSSSNRWAFAFSAKKVWRGKVKSDVAKIAKTKRGYSKCFFITNQFVSDKKRAEVEDELSKEHQLDVRIFDRNWLCEQIEKNEMWQTVGAILNIPEFTQWKKIQGPEDTRREDLLAELDSQTSDASRYRGLNGQKALDCLASARLAAELNKNRFEVDGRYTAAIKIAETCENPHYLIRALYGHAWISCFYYDDHQKVLELYERIEPLCLETGKASDVSDLSNLWNLLSGGVASSQLDSDTINFWGKGAEIEKACMELMNDLNRPNNAAEAEFLLASSRLVKAVILKDDEEAESQVGALKKIFEKIDGLGQFPYLQYEQIITEGDDIYGSISGFEELYDFVLHQASQRTSEREVGERLVKKAWGRHEKRDYSAVVRSAGKAKRFLVKEESKSVLFDCLVVLGLGYKGLGLHWAGRSSLYSAATLSFQVEEKGKSYHPMTWLLFKPLCWHSLELGRVDEVVLSLIFSFRSLDGHSAREDRLEKSAEFVNLADALLSILILKTPLSDLSKFSLLHDHLEALILEQSRAALLYSLGYTKESEAILIETIGTSSSSEDYFQNLLQQPAAKELPDSAASYRADNFAYFSRILGAEVVISGPMKTPLQFFSESILGSLESFFSTGFLNSIAPVVEKIKIEIKQVNIPGEKSYDLSIKNESIILSVDDKKTDHWGPDHAVFVSAATDVINLLLERCFVVMGGEASLKTLFEDEESMARSSIYVDICSSFRYLFKGWPVGDENFFSKTKDATEYPLVRDQHWNTRTSPVNDSHAESPEVEAMELGDELIHDQVTFQTNIDYNAFNEAQWLGLAFGLPSAPKLLLGLIFKNQKAAQKIMSGWLNKFGNSDDQNKLAITIVTGVSKKNPSHYRVVLGSSLDGQKEDLVKGSVISNLGRVHLMEPLTSENLDSFLGALKNKGEYDLNAVVLNDENPFPVPVSSRMITKKHLNAIPAWQVELNTLAMLGIQPGDEPVIPADIESPPVLKVLDFLASKNYKRRTP